MSAIGCCESSTRLGGSTTSATSRPAACSLKTASRETEWEREDLEQSTRGFICWCADQLAETAGLAIELATVLCAEVEDHKSRSEIVDELRSELMMELAIEAAPPTRHAPLSATKRAVADDVEVGLRVAAGDLAKAAFELADSRWPAQAASTAVYIAAQAAGGRIAANVVQLRVRWAKGQQG